MNIGKQFQQSGPATRSRAMQRKYNEYLNATKEVACVFCVIRDEQPETIIEENGHTLVVENRFGYMLWDGCEVIEHLMIIPKAHRDEQDSFTEDEMGEWLAESRRYEKKGYSLYTRSQDNVTRSIMHHHTHFIRLGKRRKKYLFYVRKPHILLTK